MGYTHYFRQNKSFNDSQWQQVVEGIKRIFDYCEEKKIKLQFEYNDPRPPVANEKCIRFNGKDEDGHETFYLVPESGGFQFCKTADKPYDLAVCLCLLYIESVAPGILEIKSDGNWEFDWVNARNAYASLFGTDPPVLSLRE
jgi:hypothetical protein